MNRESLKRKLTNTKLSEYIILEEISHTCNFRRNLNVRNKFVWIPKGQVRSSANHVGLKYKWVPKHPPSALLVQERSRVPLTPKKRTRGDATAETPRYNHKKQCAITRNNGSVSRMSYHRVPFNYPEKNKREWIPRSTLRRLWLKRRSPPSVSHQTVKKSQLLILRML